MIVVQRNGACYQWQEGTNLSDSPQVVSCAPSWDFYIKIHLPSKLKLR